MRAHERGVLSVRTGERLGFSEEAKAAQHQRNEVLEEFERKKRARALALPTDDKKVRLRLRDLEEPQCLFGETVGGAATARL